MPRTKSPPHPGTGRRAARSACGGVALAAAAFMLAVLFLMAADFARFRAADPLNAESLVALRDKIKKDPKSVDRREEFRRLDLLVRRAYFSSVSFRRRGAYLLLGGVVVLILALKARRSLAPRPPDPGPWPGRAAPASSPAAARRFVALTGGALVLAAAALAFLFRAPIPPVGETPEGAPPLPFVEDEATAATDDEGLRQWPSFRGPGGLGVATFTTAPTDWDGREGRNVIWKTPIPRPGFSSPVVWGERIFITGGDETAREVYCYDAGSGELLWRRAVSGPEALPEVTEDTGHAAATAATDGRRLFALFSTGDLAAFDLAGRPLWSINLGLPDNPYGHASSLVSWRDRLFVQYDHRRDARILALSAATGEVLWEQVRALDVCWSSPVLVTGAAGTELVLNGNPAVVSYDPMTGIELWRVECMSGEVASSPASAGGMVFVANEYARLAALIPGETPSIAWEYYDGLPEVSSPAATREYLFMANGYGIVTCLDRHSGALLWEKEFDEGFYASPIVVGDRVYLMDRAGTMQIFAAAGEFRLLGSPGLGEPSTATGAFLDGRIYLRGAEHLFCIGMRE